MPLPLIIAEYFEDTRPVAMGISSCGGGLGQLIYPLMFNYFEATYTWRGAFLIFGGLSFNALVCGALMRPNLSYRHIKSEPKTFNFDIFKNKYLLLFFCGTMCYAFAASILYSHFSEIAQSEDGIPEHQTSYLYSIIGVTSTVAKTVLGCIIHHPSISVYGVYIVTKTVFAAGTLILIIHSLTFAILVCYAFLYGIGDSVFGGALLPEMLVDIAGVENLPESYGTLQLICSLGQLLGAPCAGEYIIMLKATVPRLIWITNGYLILKRDMNRKPVVQIMILGHR